MNLRLLYYPSRYFIYVIFFSILFLFNIEVLVAETDLSESRVIAKQEDVWWLSELFGRLHPMFVHFPVALLIVAGVMELSRIKNFNSSLRLGINWMVYIGAISALLVAAQGWILATNGAYDGEVFHWHKWSGIVTACLSLMIGITLWLILKRGIHRLIFLYRFLLFTTVVSVFIVGHYGGSLTHGQGYLSDTFPWSDAQNESYGTSFASWSDSSGDSLSIEQQVELNMAVRAILAHHCYQCHSSDKVEGGLRLDQKDFVFKGGDSGPVLVAYQSKQSELVRRITLPAGHKEAMPGKGKPLIEKDIKIIKLWIDKGAPWPDAAKSIFRVAPLAPRNPELPPAKEGLNNPIDRLVDVYFEKNNIKWDQVVNDRIFLRRVYFDIIGLPPSEQELRNFEQDQKVDKREWMIEKLLSQNHAYATHWTSFWNDLLRNDYTGTGYITGGRYNISAWLYESLLNNKPYKQFVQELLNPSDASKGFIKGIEWRGAVNSSQTTAMQAAQNVSQALLGVNLKCASCHDSFVSDWKLEDAYAFANVFSEKPLEINRCDIPTGKMAKMYVPWPELGAISEQSSVSERAMQLAQLLTQPQNGRLYRTVVNRIWAQLMGRGIVSPTDEMDRKPWSEDLLDWLAYHFVEDGYDIKKLMYQIMTSKTYQQPSVAYGDPSQLDDERFVFKGMLKRKLTAEQFADAVGQVLQPLYKLENIKYNPFGEADKLSQHVQFVRAALVENDAFQKAMGRPTRETITSVREGQATLLQAMELTNGQQLNGVIIQGAKQWVDKIKNSEELIEAVYLQVIGRKPTGSEIKTARKLMGDQVNTEGIEDLIWALLLHPEFQFID